VSERDGEKHEVPSQRAVGPACTNGPAKHAKLTTRLAPASLSPADEGVVGPRPLANEGVVFGAASAEKVPNELAKTSEGTPPIHCWASLRSFIKTTSDVRRGVPAGAEPERAERGHTPARPSHVRLPLLRLEAPGCSRAGVDHREVRV
jgi:hypothetical protein